MIKDKIKNKWVISQVKTEVLLQQYIALLSKNENDENVTNIYFGCLLINIFIFDANYKLCL